MTGQTDPLPAPHRACSHGPASPKMGVVMTTVIRLGLLLAVAGAAGTVSVPAQSLLYAEHNGQFSLVTQVNRDTPMVVVGDKLEAGSNTRFALRPVERFAPYYVMVRDLELTSRSMEFVGAPKDLNNEFDFRAEFESGYRLPNVFVVVEISGEGGDKSLLVREVGDLAPREPVRIAYRAQLDQKIGPFRYHLHVYSNGPEVFSSKLPKGVRERALNKMVAEKLMGMTNSDPQPLVGPQPLYPKTLAEKRVSGSATVSFVVTPAGMIKDPVVTEATEPGIWRGGIAGRSRVAVFAKSRGRAPR